MSEETVRYITANSTDAGAIPVNTEVATHTRASDGKTVQDVYAEQLTDGTQKTQVVGGAGDVAEVITGYFTGEKGLRVYIGPTDPVSDLPVFVDYNHHQNHEGESFQYNYPLTALANGASVDFLIVVPVYANLIHTPHVYIDIDTLAQTTMSLYETPTTTANGTLQASRNRNRNSTNTPGMAIYRSPTVTAVGTLLDQRTVGDAGTGAWAQSLDEWILKSNTIYLLRLTSGSSGNSVGLRIKWYEDLGV